MSKQVEDFFQILWPSQKTSNLTNNNQYLVTCSRHQSLKIFEFQFSKSLFIGHNQISEFQILNIYNKILFILFFA